MSALLFDLYGFLDRDGVMWRTGEPWEANELLRRHHYLGPLNSGGRMTVIGSRGSEPVAAIRFWEKNATDDERRWARNSLNLDGAA